MTLNKFVKKVVTINAKPSMVWDALTTPELIRLWLSETQIKISSDWKVGSSITFTGSAHDVEYHDKGIILRFDKEKNFQYSYLSAFSNLSDIPENYSVIEFSLTPVGNKTMLTLIHSNFVTETIYKHSIFYWTATIPIIKGLTEEP